MHVEGGSHGSLHALDSATALLIAGAEDPSVPDDRPWRSVDISPLLLSLLNLPSPCRLALLTVRIRFVIDDSGDKNFR